MSHWRSGTFWASAILGWFVTMLVLALFISLYGSDQMSMAEGVVVNVLHQLVSVSAGYAYGRRKFELSRPQQIGFPVILKDDGDAAER